MTTDHLLATFRELLGSLETAHYLLDNLVRAAEHVPPQPGGPLTRRLNSPVLQNEIAARLLEEDGLCEVVDIWWESDGRRYHRLFSRPGGVDVAAIAARHGGGGHTAAAGYSTPA